MSGSVTSILGHAAAGASAGSPARIAPMPPASPPARIEPDGPAMVPVAEPVEEPDRLIELCGYISSTSASGYGQVNGYEFVFTGGARVQYGRCKGRCERFRLAEREALLRVAGRIDTGRRQRGAPPSAPRACLVSIQFTTSKQREVVFGLAHRTRSPSSFSLVAEYRMEATGVRLLDPSVPIVTSLQTQPRPHGALPSQHLSQLPTQHSLTMSFASTAAWCCSRSSATPVCP